jgi:hypothetical protein
VGEDKKVTMSTYPHIMPTMPLNSSIQYSIIEDMKKKKVCEECGCNYETYQAFSRYCGQRCKGKANYKSSGRSVHGDNKLPSATVGAMSEIFVSAELMKKGYAVFRALSPSCFCDLIAIKNNQTLRIEARTGYKNTRTNRMCYPKNTHGDITHFAIYERNEGKTYFFDTNHNEIMI